MHDHKSARCTNKNFYLLFTPFQNSFFFLALADLLHEIKINSCKSKFVNKQSSNREQEPLSIRFYFQQMYDVGVKISIYERNKFDSFLSW